MNSGSAVKHADKIPYVFVLDHLLIDDLVIKPMFGCYGIYAGKKLCLFLVERDVWAPKSYSDPMRNGVYVATLTKHIPQMETEFAGARFQHLKGDKVWIFIPNDHPRFESLVIKACEMITANDIRIGR